MASVRQPSICDRPRTWENSSAPSDHPTARMRRAAGVGAAASDEGQNGAVYPHSSSGRSNAGKQMGEDEGGDLRDLPALDPQHVDVSARYAVSPGRRRYQATAGCRLAPVGTARSWPKSGLKHPAIRVTIASRPRTSRRSAASSSGRPRAAARPGRPGSVAVVGSPGSAAAPRAPRRSERWPAPTSSRPAGSRARSVERARWRALLTDGTVVSSSVGRFPGRPPEGVAQDQHRPLPGRQVLDRRQKGQLDRLARDDHGFAALSRRGAAGSSRRSG